MIEDDKQRPERIPVSTIRMEEGAEELLKSPEAQPYMRLAEAVVAGRDAKPALHEISKLPLEKRYLWRVVSALKWGFVDLDDLSIVADRETLSREDFARIVSLVRLRPLQFCIFLTALLGSDGMEQTMTEAIGQAKKGPTMTI
jgi:hypothetical protein